MRVYGVPNPVQNPKVLAKQWKTKKIRGTFGGPHSQQENRIYEVLCEKYGKDNVERQYKSELYPFACDFYILSEDLYIEYNGLWTHGHTPYIGSKENDVKLEKWKQKAVISDYYKSAIETWTISDVKKRNTAKENNLNYIELWDLNDVESYVSKLNFK